MRKTNCFTRKVKRFTRKVKCFTRKTICFKSISDIIIIIIIIIILILFNHQYLKRCVQSEVVYRNNTTQEVAHYNHRGYKQQQGCGLYADTVQPYI